VKKLILTLAILILAVSAATAQSKLETNFQQLSDEVLQNLQSFYPVTATARGIHDYDYRFTDYSSGSIKKEISRLKKFETRLYKYQKSKLSAESRINLKLLKSNVDVELVNLNKIKIHKKNPFIYVDDAVTGIYLLLISEYAPMETRVQNIIARMKTVPDLFKQGRKNLKNPPPVFIESALEMLETGVDFYRTVQTDLAGRFPELAPELNTAVERAVSSMLEFKVFLESITPGEELSFAVGKNNYDYFLQHQYFLDFDSDSLLKIGQNMLDEAKQKYNDYLAEIESSGTRVDSVFVIDCISKDDVLRYYNWEVNQTRLFLEENDIVTVPEDVGDCIVVETPPFLTSMISSIAYEPPGVFSPVQTGHFYVRPIPDSMDTGQREARYKYIHRRGFKGSVVHEAYPGHHLQLQLASKLDDDVRKWQESMMLIEGWALYCEEMMSEYGYYEDERQYLRVLGGIMFRAARIVLDVRLQTGGMSIDEAVRFMADVMDTEPADWMRTEINRYVQQPTVPMCYLTGKREVLRLRDDLKAAEGDNFSLKNFHDRLLAEGSIPPALIREIWGLNK